MGLFEKFLRVVVNSYITVLVVTAAVCLVVGGVAGAFFF